MVASGPMLELRAALPSFDESGLTPVPFDLRLMPGDSAVIECRDPRRATLFADLCCGMVPLAAGSVRFMGLDWQDLGDRQLNALRGRVGRIARQGAWVDLFGTHLNIMLPQLHHTTRPTDEVIDAAMALGQAFGFPGLPVSPPGRLSAADLARAACVRAFLGRPDLLLLEDVSDTLPPDAMLPFLEAVTAARDRGAAVVWFARNAAVWHEYRKAVNVHLRLLDEGLFVMRGV
ncbi:ABC transporter ATP-binding protein [Gluconacetobacter johannae DSM 13595]|uniref:ABC transporter ATP-binding protein n=1 Tax=Gluconacetobacter johannae TaxID=112140 RepID=A0A7W4J759_9PROT|nr:ABC transporter ATP-binding protein [Gluconacetobacter johannae]MBB2175866.1 ABC transporter ATP-binding protein [Gluconacetobacter johannae]GBQ81410.1 ABC transporter ATP-binding protein [Gluconacetobacter johannae DSM 13595]